MNGEVIYFDAERGNGFIAGRDGNRYVFDRADVAGGEGVIKGDAVDFTADGDRARRVRPPARRQRGSAVLDRRPDAAAPGRSVPAVPAGATAAARAAGRPGATPGLFGYFWRALTADYANFRGRARRREFWSFALISVLLIVALTVAGFSLDFASGNLTSSPVGDQMNLSGAPYATVLLGVGAWLALIVPSLAVTVRRIHDIGLSGWLILLNFIPSIGTLIVFVLTLIPSQARENAWGPVPAGVGI